MRTEKKEIQKIEYVTTYIANDGTEFKSEEECRKYEETAECAIRGMFKGLKPQHTERIGESGGLFTAFDYDDDVFAVKVENASQLEILNKWVKMLDPGNYLPCFTDEAIGTIQLIVENYDGNLWFLGTPEEFKKLLNEEVDSLFNKLIEKAEEPKGENA